MRLRLPFAIGILIAVVAAPLLVSFGAEPKATEFRLGVYFFKNPNGLWIITFSEGGKGHVEAKLIVNGEVRDDRYEFSWSRSGNEIARTRKGNPNLGIVEYEIVTLDGALKPLKSQKDGKLLWEAPKDIGPLEYLGKVASPTDSH